MRKSIFDIFDQQDEQKVIMIPMEEIVPSKYQPRLKFDEESLQELADSIRENGLIQPITVRKIDQHYEIIAGERRYRACQINGFEKVPCYVMSPTEEEAAQMAIVENVQRKDLSAIEEARSYVQIMRQANITQEQVAQKVGKSQSAVANKIRLLNLPNEIQEGVIDGQITERHARALLSVPKEKQKETFHYLIDHQLNVRESENYIEKIAAPKKHRKRQKTKGFTRNIQIAVNSVNQCVSMIEKMGIDVSLETQDANDELKMVIHLPK